MFALTEVGKHLALCDGIGCAAMGMQDLNIAHTEYIAYELNPVARQIAKFANPKVNHDVGNDVMDITEVKVRDMGRITSMSITAPCSDMSDMRNFVDGEYQPIPDKRPGLDGPSGMIVRHCLQVLDGTYDRFFEL